MAHVSVLYTPVDLNLAHQLLLCPTFGQARLLDYFGSVDESCVSIDEFVAFSEATFAEELAFDVSADADFSALLLKFLLNDGLGRAG